MLALRSPTATSSRSTQRALPLRAPVRALRCSSTGRSPTTMALTLFTVPGSRAQIIEWYAKEVGTVLALKPAGDRASAAYLAVHPFGKLPAAVCEDGTPIFESGAILLYLADKFGSDNTPEKRVNGSKWVVWANASFWPAVEGQRKAPPAMLAGVEKILAKQPFLLGPDFSVADAAVGSYLHYCQAFFRETFQAYPAVKAYLAAIQKRPHFKSTIGAE